MASLKEIKNRIGTVQSTLKITSAMKLVSSAKLHKAQQVIENMQPYNESLNRILKAFLGNGEGVDSPYIQERPVDRVIVITIASSSSLCGGYNSNMIKQTLGVLNEYEHLHKKDLRTYPIGKKMHQAMSYRHDVVEDYTLFAEKPRYRQAAELADHLMTLYRTKQVDRVELLYMHYHSTAKQEFVRETFLPIPMLSTTETEERMTDYLIEPSRAELLAELLPQALRMKMFTVLQDASTAEHAARMMAMQMATDNANDLLQELNILHNKSRQQAITNELLDIVGGTMA